MTEPVPDSRVERFEQQVILRVSRTMYLSMAAIASLGGLLGVLAITYGVLPTIRGADPAEPPPPAPPSVSLAEVIATLDADAPVAEEDVLIASLDGAPDEPDPDAVRAQRFEEVAGRLGALFDQTRHPWLSETENYCASGGYYGCYRYDTRTLRKGVVETINATLSRTPRDEHVDTIQALVDVASKVGDGLDATARDDLRFVAVGATLDLIAAADGIANAPIDALVAALEGAGKPVDSDTARDVLFASLEMRKRGRDQALLASWFGVATRLRGLFGNDAEGKSNRVAGMAACWDALQGTVPTLFDQRISAIEAIASEAEEARRPEVVRAYGSLVRERSVEARADYLAKLNERAIAIAELDAAAEQTRARKEELRYNGAAVVASALGTLAVLGLLLALLAVERNTRALRDVLDRLDAK